MKKKPIPKDAVVVWDKSYQDKEPGEIVDCNVAFVNALFEEYLTAAEISPGAMRSYYVDYYLGEVNNGGFSQFVYNSRWAPVCITAIKEGLKAMGAKRHLVVFNEGEKLVKKFGTKRLERYLASEYFGDNKDRDALNAINDRFFKAEEKEDLLALNAAWLRKHPKLVVLNTRQMAAEIRKRGKALPDREQRIAEARENEPRYMKLIRALCEKAGHELDRVTAGDPTHVYRRVPTEAWHFLTDKGHHYMVEFAGKAIMFRGDSKTARVCQIDAYSD